MDVLKVWFGGTGIVMVALGLISSGSFTALAGANPIRQDVAVTVTFEELSRFATPLAEDIRAAGGDGDAYITGLAQSHRWVRVDPNSGLAETSGQRGKGPGEVQNVDLVTGSSSRGREYVVHDRRLSIITSDGYIGGRFLPGTPIAAQAGEDGSARFVVQDSRGIAIVHIPATSRRELDVTVIEQPFGNRTSLIKTAAIGSDRIYVADLAQGHEIAAFDFNGSPLMRWRRAGEAEPPSDEWGRPTARILGIHEADSLVLLTSSVLKEGASGLYGSFTAYEEQNDFYLHIIDRNTGQRLATSSWERPPFYGSISQDVVYRIYENQTQGETTLVFLSLSISNTERSPGESPAR